MATFYPDAPDPDTPDSEGAVWAALEQLPHSWRVFHSVGFQVQKRDRVFDGEADFVLVHKRHGVIVLEVKGGEQIWVEDGVWYQRSHTGARHRLKQSPFDQAKGAMYDLREYLDATVAARGGIPHTRAVVFPFISHPGSMGPDAPAEQIISRDELTDMPAAIERLIRYAKLDADIDPESISRLTELLAPTRRLTVLLRTTIAESMKKIIQLTEQQVRLLDFLRRQRRALISGVAGTGKTILAVERARRLGDEGFRTLLLCFNRPLADHIATTLDEENVTVGSFHQFALGFVREAGFVGGFEPSKEWWESELPDLLPQAAERLERKFDALVIDEGQDFRPEWFMALQYLMEDPDQGPMYVFYDEKQTIYVDGWEPPFDAEPFHLDTNCRNTLPIAERVAFMAEVTTASLGAEGPPPVWVPAESETEVREQLDRVIRGLLTEQGIEPGQIVVLTDRRPLADALRGEKIGGTSLHALGAKSGSVVETVHRFKGLESDVIILVVSTLDEVRDRALAYIGMSRARVVLIVIGPAAAQKAAGW